MPDSKARLHCCGAHHQNPHTAAGLNLTVALGTQDNLDVGLVECYGTGENEDSALLFIPDQHYKWDDLHTRLLADKIARGANITVLIPNMVLHSSGNDAGSETHGQKRNRDEAFSPTTDKTPPLDGTEQNYIALVAHLKQTMNVSFLAVLRSADASRLLDSTRVQDAFRDKLECHVILTQSLEYWNAFDACSVPTSVLLLTTGDGTQEIREDPVLLRKTQIKADVTSMGLLNHEQACGYNECMKEILYFLKKHLHDWS